MGIVVDATRNFDNGVTTVRLDGELTLATAPTVRSQLAKCASECPAAVIVDLAALDVANRGLLALFAAASRRARAQWGVPLLLCCAGPDIARTISLFRPFTEVYDSPGSAMQALDDRVSPWRHQRFPPVSTSAALARHLVASSCQEWGLAHLREPATLVASELASNAIQHAATAFDVTVSHTTTYLRIAVQDGGAAPLEWIPHGAPGLRAADRGLGLYVVDALATTWNTIGVPDGKIVWALLRTRTADSPHGVDSLAARPPYQHGTTQILAGAKSNQDPGTTPPHGSLRGQSHKREDLSAREVDVLTYLPTMLTAGEIAVEMHVSVNTVKAHMRSIYTKLDVSRRQDAVFRAYERGLLS